MFRRPRSAKKCINASRVLLNDVGKHPALDSVAFLNCLPGDAKTPNALSNREIGFASQDPCPLYALKCLMKAMIFLCLCGFTQEGFRGPPT